MNKRVSIRQLRENIATLLDEVAGGEQLVITRRGQPVARLIPEAAGAPQEDSRHPLRGSVLAVSADFDEPLDELWSALET
jgi:prevent-host-death family protein